MLHSINPRTGAERDPIEEATVQDVADAVDRAAAAAPDYAAMPLAKRAAYLRAVADALEAARSRLSRWQISRPAWVWRDSAANSTAPLAKSERSRTWWRPVTFRK